MPFIEQVVDARSHIIHSITPIDGDLDRSFPTLNPILFDLDSAGNSVLPGFLFDDCRQFLFDRGPQFNIGIEPQRPASRPRLGVLKRHGTDIVPRLCNQDQNRTRRLQLVNNPAQVL